MDRMAQVKTTETDASVAKFLNAVPSETTRQDCRALIDLMSAATGCPAKMWGSSIVGFDQYQYRHANGKLGEICLVGFSPRKQNLVLYVTDDHQRDADLLSKLGNIKTGKSCIYVKTLRDLHLATLKRLLRRAVKARRETSSD